MIYIINSSDWAKIINCASEDWKEKLSDYAKEHYQPGQGGIVVNKGYRDRMLAASITHKGIDQRKVIEEVFGMRTASIDDPHEQFKEAYREGKIIQVRDWKGTWRDLKYQPHFNAPPENYRIKHKHQDLMDAYEKDPTLQMQFLEKDSPVWKNCKSIPVWAEDLQYRIKPKEEYVPFTFEDAEFLIGKIVKSKDKSVYYVIKCVSNVTGITLGNMDLSYASLLSYYTFLDGSECGKLKQ